MPVDLLDILDKLYADSSKVISACKNFKDQLENNDDLSIEGFSLFASSISNFRYECSESFGVLKNYLANIRLKEYTFFQKEYCVQRTVNLKKCKMLVEVQYVMLGLFGKRDIKVKQR